MRGIDVLSSGELPRDRDAQDRKERRERIATAVLAGFASNPDLLDGPVYCSERAVTWADALIAELDKP